MKITSIESTTMGLQLNNNRLDWQKVIFLPTQKTRYAASIPEACHVEFHRKLTRSHVLIHGITLKRGDIVIRENGNIFPCQKPVFNDFYKMQEKADEPELQDETGQDS